MSAHKDISNMNELVLKEEINNQKKIEKLKASIKHQEKIKRDLDNLKNKKT